MSLAGSLYQLLSNHNSPETKYINDDPEITLFKSVFRRHIPFSVYDCPTSIKNEISFGKKTRFKLPKVGDILNKLYLKLNISDPVLDKIRPTVKNIIDIFSNYNIDWDGDNMDNNKILKLNDYSYKEDGQVKNGILKNVIKNRIQNLISNFNTILDKVSKIEELLNDDNFVNEIKNSSDGNNILSIEVFQEILEIENNNVNKKLYDFLVAYYRDLLNFDTPLLLNSGKFRNKLYQALLKAVVEETVNSMSDVNIYSNIKVYHVFDFWNIEKLSGQDLLSIFNNVLNNDYSNASDFNITLDTEIILNRFFNEIISQRRRFNSSIENAVVMRDRLLNNMFWNFRLNYRQFIKYLEFLKGNVFNNNNHFRFAISKKFIQQNNIVSPFGADFFSLFSDNLSSDITNNLNELEVFLGDVPDNVEPLIVNDTDKKLVDFISNIFNEIRSLTNINTYLEEYSLWTDLTTSGTYLENLFSNFDQSIKTVYDDYSNLSKVDRVSWLNFTPFFLIYDMPEMLYLVLNSKNYSLTILNALDYREENNGNSEVQSLHKTLIENLIKNILKPSIDTSTDFIDINYFNSFNNNNLARDEKIILGLLRPEGLIDINGEVYTPMDYVKQKYHNEWFNEIDNLSVSTSTKNDLKDIVKNVEKSFFSTEIKSFASYSNAGYTNYPNNVISFQDFTLHDAITSIWNKIYQIMITQYNNILNNSIFLTDDYKTKYGITMVDNINLMKNELTNIKNGSFSDFGSGLNFYAIRNDSEYNNSIEKINDRLDYFNDLFIRYEDLKPVLNIKNINDNSKGIRFNTATNIIDSLVSILKNNYTSGKSNETSLNNLIDSNKTQVINDNKGVSNYIDTVRSNIPTDNLEKNIKEILHTIKSGEINEIDSGNQLSKVVDWYNNNINSNSEIDDILNYYNNTLANYTKPEDLATARLIVSFYDNYKNYQNTLLFIIHRFFNLENSRHFINLFSDSVLKTSSNYFNHYGDNLRRILNDIDGIGILSFSIVVGSSSDDGKSLIINSEGNEILEYSDIIKKDGERNFVTHVNSTLEKELKSVLNPNPPKYNWIEELGNNLIINTKIIFNGTVIEVLDTDLLKFLGKILVNDELKNVYNKMIGNTNRYTDFSFDKKGDVELYIPLPFWFTRFVSYSLPLIGLVQSDIYLEFDIETIDNVLNKEFSSFFVKKPQIRGELLGKYFFLDTDQREYFGTKRLDYLINRFVNTADTLYNDNNLKDNKLRLDVIPDYLTKFFMWTIFMVDENYNKVPVDNSFVKSLKIKYSGRDRESKISLDMYNLIRPYEGGLPSLPSGYFFYNPSLFPLSMQPSGHSNLTHFDDYVIIIELTDKGMDYLKNKNYQIEFKHWVQTIDILSVYSGMAGLIF